MIGYFLPRFDHPSVSIITDGSIFMNFLEGVGLATRNNSQVSLVWNSADPEISIDVWTH